MNTLVHKGMVIPFDGNMEAFVETRKSLGYSQKVLAETLGLSDVSVIGHFESGGFILDERTHTIFLLLTDTHPIYKLERKEGKEDAELIIDPPETGEEMRDYRNKINGMTQGDMADLLGLRAGKTIISNYENNVKRPSKQNWTTFLLATDLHPNFTVTRTSKN